MDIKTQETKEGLSVTLKDKKFPLKFPKHVWNSYPSKQVLIDNLAHLMTINVPLVAGFDKLNYNTALPFFSPHFFEMVLRDIPTSVYEYEASAKDKIKEFMNIKYKFQDYNVKIPKYAGDYSNRAIIPLSNGKDSLLTLGVSHEIGLDPISVYINDTISPVENKFKIQNTKASTSALGTKHFIVENQIQKLNDFDYWNKDCIDLGFSHMITGFCFIALPFCHHYNAGNIILGNQRNMNFSFKGKEDFTCYPTFDQRRETTKTQDSMIRLMTHGGANVSSVIEPLTNLGIMKILHSRYPNISKYTMSCDLLDNCNQKRWCYDCGKCARLFMMMKAFDFDTKTVGYTKNLLEKKYKKLYALFDGDVDQYEKSPQARDEQLLAFYLARNNAKGYLMDLFKKKYLKEAKEREDELRKEFLGIYKSITMPQSIKNQVLSIYKEELSPLN